MGLSLILLLIFQILHFTGKTVAESCPYIHDGNVFWMSFDCSNGCCGSPSYRYCCPSSSSGSSSSSSSSSSSTSSVLGYNQIVWIAGGCLAGLTVVISIIVSVCCYTSRRRAARARQRVVVQAQGPTVVMAGQSNNNGQVNGYAQSNIPMQVYNNDGFQPAGPSQQSGYPSDNDNHLPPPTTPPGYYSKPPAKF